MGIRDVQTIEFEYLPHYLTWSNLQYYLQNGVRICGLRPINDGKYEADYIKLF